jgi:phosphatidylserine/phosphatidylglycerophosphate/cardiolipin synthase-like enzyme
MQTIIGKNYPKQVIPLLDGAKNSIKVVVFDWRWYENDPGNPCQLFNMAFVRAVRRGVQVQACVNSNSIATPLSQNGINVKIPVSEKLMHSKFIIIDDKILVMGSHNFSQSAFTQNMETSMIIDDVVEIQNFITFFNSIWSM